MQMYFVEQKNWPTSFVGVGLCIWKHLDPLPLPPSLPIWKGPCVCNCMTPKLLAHTNPVSILELKLLIYCSLNLSLYKPFGYYIGLLNGWYNSSKQSPLSTYPYSKACILHKPSCWSFWRCFIDRGQNVVHQCSWGIFGYCQLTTVETRPSG